jgi:hypothetical protein
VGRVRRRALDQRLALPDLGAYTESVKEIWTGRIAQAAGRYGEHAPAATVCCNACRTCVTTNLVALVTGAAAAAVLSVGRLARRLGKTS